MVAEILFPPFEAKIEEFVDSLKKSKDDPSVFLESLAQSPISEIMDSADPKYRIHWATKQSNCPPEIDEGMVRGRHDPFNWLTSYEGENGDYVATDT